MKYLQECIDFPEFLIEQKDPSKPKEYFIEGIFMQGNIKNRNGRIYPIETLIKEADRYTEEKIKTKRSLGELNHNSTISIDPERASHMITKLWVEGDNIMGRAKILDTPMGKIVKTLMDEGVKIGVSSRGFGSVNTKGGVKMVGEDFHLATVDIVSDPSAPDAWTESIMESKEFTLVDGQIIEVNEATEKAILAKHGVEFLNEEELNEDETDYPEKINTARKRLEKLRASGSHSNDDTIRKIQKQIENLEQKYHKQRMSESLDEDALLEGFEKLMLSEISKETLGSYVKKAGEDVRKKSAAASRLLHDPYGKDIEKAHDNHNIARKRQKGINKAVDKLTSEKTYTVTGKKNGKFSSIKMKAKTKADAEHSMLEKGFSSVDAELND